MKLQQYMARCVPSYLPTGKLWAGYTAMQKGAILGRILRWTLNLASMVPDYGAYSEATMYMGIWTIGNIITELVPALTLNG